MDTLLIGAWVLAWVLAGPVLLALWQDSRSGWECDEVTRGSAKRETEELVQF